jgi:DNA-binding NtrC family response regulator
MKESILNGKSILAVDDELDILTVLEEEILHACSNCKFEKATTFEEASKKLAADFYNLLILDIMGVRGFDLLERAVLQKIPVLMLTAHALTPGALKRSIEMGARAYLPKEKLGEVVPFLEDVLTYEYLSGWKRLLTKMEEFFNTRWGEDWKKTDEEFWKDFEEKSKHLIVW